MSVKVEKVTPDSGITMPSKHLMFEDVFDSFNAPGVWKVNKEEDIDPVGIIQDGHTTVLLYDPAGETPWILLPNEGAFRVTPEKIGEGALMIQHSCEFQIDIYFKGKRIDLLAKCDASGAGALQLTLRHSTIDNIYQHIVKRLRNSLMKAVMTYDKEIPDVGLTLLLPEDSLEQLNFELGLMGLNYDSSIVKKVSDEAPPDELLDEVAIIQDKEDSVIDALKEVGTPSAPVPQVLDDVDEEEEEMDEYEKIPPAQPMSMPRPAPPPADKSEAPKPAPAPGIPSPTPKMDLPSPKAEERTVAAAGPSIPSLSPAPPPEMKKTAQIPPLPQKPTEKKEAEQKPSARSRSASRKKKSKTKQAMDLAPPDEVLASSIAEEMEEAGEMPAPSTEGAFESEGLMTGGMSTTEEVSLRSVKASWYDSMVIQRTYDFVIRVSERVLTVEKRQINRISGESRSEKVDQIEIKADMKIYVDAVFPGCLVTPTSGQIGENEVDGEVVFYVTPLSRGNHVGQIIFHQNETQIGEISLNYKVITHRAATALSYVSAATSAVPAALGYVTGLTLAQLLSPAFLTLYATSAGMAGVAGLSYFLRGRKRRKDFDTALTI